MLSAVVTHSHSEAIAGAIGVAVGAALAAGTDLRGAAFLDAVIEAVPSSQVRDSLDRASGMLHLPPEAAAQTLGNGSEVSAQDTVPFCLWVAGRHLDDYEAALWETVGALGDVDMTCAIVAARVGRTAIPAAWRTSREPLPPWVRDIEAGVSAATARARANRARSGRGLVPPNLEGST